MFNKKLIAGSILAVASSAALAAPTFDFVQGDYSSQGAASRAIFTAPALKIESGAELSNDDLIKVSFNAAYDTTNAPASNVYMYATCVGQTDGTPTATENGGIATLGLLSSDSSSVTYRVTDITFATTTANTASTGCTPGAVDTAAASENSTVGAVWSLAGGKFAGAALRSAGSLTATYHATLPNGTTDIDGGSTSVVDNNATPADLTDDVSAMIAFKDQYVLDTTALVNDGFAKKIDVTLASNPRSAFTTGAGAAAYQDTLTIQLNEVASTNSNASGEVVTAVVTGDFSFLEDSDLTTAGIQNAAVTATVTSAATVTFTASSITVVGAAGKVDDIVISFDNALNGAGTTLSKIAMVAGPFTSAVSIAYADAGIDGTAGNADDVAGSSAESTANSAGAWTLNGSTSIVEAYPVSAGVTQFLWVTNTGSEVAGISVTAIGDGGTMASCDVGSVAANDLTYVAGLVKTCLDTASFGTDRVQLTVTVNASKENIAVYAGYKVDADADRLALNVIELP